MVADSKHTTPPDKVAKLFKPLVEIQNRTGIDPEFFVIDFKDRIELHVGLLERAAINFRSPQDELLFILNQALAGQRPGAP